MSDEQTEVLLRAAQSVVSDVTAMSAGSESFGPFPEGEIVDRVAGEEHYVEWPNLAITIAAVNDALKPFGRGV